MLIPYPPSWAQKLKVVLSVTVEHERATCAGKGAGNQRLHVATVHALQLADALGPASHSHVSAVPICKPERSHSKVA